MSRLVVWLPGFLGSELAWDAGPGYPPHGVWIAPIELLGGGMQAMELDSTGQLPGPLAGGKQIQAGPPLWELYGLMGIFLSGLGYDVLSLGYDFRLDIGYSSALLWPIIQGYAAGRPITIVAHSFGGLLARGVYQVMVSAGLGGQLERLICLGTPHYGSWLPVSLWWRQPPLYTWLTRIGGWVGQYAPPDPSRYIDAVVASWPAAYQLMPFRAFGPLALRYPAQAAAIYDPAFYAGGNESLSHAQLAGAQAVQFALQSNIPADRMIGIYGSGYPSIEALEAGHVPGTAPSYQWTTDGDGTVTVAEGALPGVPVTLVPQRHDLLPMDPRVQGLVALAIAGS